MRRLIPLLLAFVFCALLLIPQAKSFARKPAPTAASSKANQLLVKFKRQARPPRGSAQITRELLPDVALDAASLDAEGDSGAYVVQLDGSISVAEAITRAQSDSRIEYAEPNRLIEPHDTVPNDLLFNQQWSLFNQGVDIGATRAWDLTTGSDDVVIAITDTGVDINHSDLAANIWTNPAEISNNGIDDDNNGFIDDVNGWNFQGNNKQVFSDAATDRHGTFVSGIIGAVGNNGIGVSGVAWRVKLMPLKFIDRTGDTADAIRAINYAIAQKRKGVNVRAINASWGPGRSECADSFSRSLRDAISAANDAGILFVCSAGNGVCGENGFGDNLDDAPEYPAAWAGELPNVISVGAVARTDDLLFFSNYGHTSVSLAAPGDGQVTSIFPGDGYTTWSPGGTSFAAPHVTGIAALLAVREPALTPTQVKQRLISTAEPILSLASKVVSSGRANAYNALINRVPPASTLGIGAVRTNKKFVYIDGLGFMQGAMTVEVNGVAIGKSRYDESYLLPNGSTTHIFVKLGKAGVRETFPQFQQVSVTVFNQQTGERSPVYRFTR